MGKSEHKPSQNDRILRHMKVFGSITAYEAIKEYGILRLAARIADLKELGYAIDSVTERSKNRFGEKTHYKRYFLKKEGDCVG